MILLLSYYSVYYFTKATFWTFQKFQTLFKNNDDKISEEPIYITRAEIEELKHEHEMMKSELNKLKMNKHLDIN